MENELINFEGISLRKEFYKGEWWFSVIDVIKVLTDSVEPRKYWNTLKKREPQLSSVCGQLKMQAVDGRQRLTDCANTEGVLRIVMSVPSPKAEPLKLWLAQVGTERIQETENPELGFERMTEIYRAKGYTDEWIKERYQSIETRKRLTDEWKNRGVKQGIEYSILTATIAKGTFGLNPSEHKKLKGLEKPNQELRDHMTPLELIFNSLGEETTRILSIKRDAQGFEENHDAALDGGTMAGNARGNYEKQLGEKVVSNKNYLKQLPPSTDIDNEAES